MDQNALGQGECRVFKSAIALEHNDGNCFLLYVDTDSWKLKVDWKILRWAWSKMGEATLVTKL